jgi:hypothetical protein
MRSNYVWTSVRSIRVDDDDLSCQHWSSVSSPQAVIRAELAVSPQAMCADR